MLLEQRNIDVNRRNAEGETALHLAAREGNVQLIQKLLARNADVNLITKNGESVFKCAKTPEVRALLLFKKLITPSHLHWLQEKLQQLQKFVVDQPQASQKCKAIITETADLTKFQGLNAASKQFYDAIFMLRDNLQQTIVTPHSKNEDYSAALHSILTEVEKKFCNAKLGLPAVSASPRAQSFIKSIEGEDPVVSPRFSS